MPKQRDEKGIYIKQYTSITKPLVEAGLPPFELTTPISGKPTLEELEERQRSGQRLTLVERQTLLTYEVKRKHKNIETSSRGKQRETRKPIDLPILEKIDQPIFEQIKHVESQIVTKKIENTEKYMAEEWKGSTILTPEQRLQ